MDINVLLLCYNEAALLPHTIKHYKQYLPSCKITVLDNYSTDDSVKIANELGCNVLPWNSNNMMDELIQTTLRNNMWKLYKSGWIIIADMDEFICVTEEDLKNELNSGVTILNIKGYDMVGESETIDLSDIDLQKIIKYVDNDGESKKLCFLRDKITDMNYGPGSHSCNPLGIIKYSSNFYINKHMTYLGLPFLRKKLIERYNRCESMRKIGLCIHYTDDLIKIENIYNTKIKSCKLLP